MFCTIGKTKCFLIGSTAASCNPYLLLWIVRHAPVVFHSYQDRTAPYLIGPPTDEERAMITILVVILLLIALGALPTWPYSRSWGYYPSSGLGLVVLILVILLLLGQI